MLRLGDVLTRPIIKESIGRFSGRTSSDTGQRAGNFPRVAAPDEHLPASSQTVRKGMIQRLGLQAHLPYVPELDVVAL